ncbi:MAG TPA: glycosyl hydrolase family 17 protein [Steroidobacteraceae bacterium]|nr:glycosyl hydrolase family 17 protein [Steroidobacteraceae bacterium]
MSTLYQRRLSLAGLDLSGLSVDELRTLVREILREKIHGIAFSALEHGQRPGDPVHESQIRARLAVIQPYVRWIRTFSCCDGNELIPPIARDMGLNTMVGVWLGDDEQKNQLELENGIRLAQDGHVDILGVGNEVLLRGDLTEDGLLEYLARAKAALPATTIGYVDAYFEFADHPRVTDACDVILANCYPFWEGCPAEHALLYMKEMYRRAVRAGRGRKVIISETGWPNIGTSKGSAVPSFENAIKYFVDTYRWAAEDGIEVFYFSAFDEAWKVEAEGDVGAYWGLWDKDGRPKYG